METGFGITKKGCFVCNIGAMQVDNDIWFVDGYTLKYFNRLKEEQNKEIDSKWYLKEKAKERIRKRIYSMEEYANPDIETDLTRFDFCPYCGQPIDWKRIGGMDNEVD